MAVSPAYLGFAFSMIVVGIIFSVHPNHKLFGLNADDTIIITLICLLCVNASIATVINLSALSSCRTAEKSRADRNLCIFLQNHYSDYAP